MTFLMQMTQSPSRQELLRSMSRGFQKTESSSTWWGLFWLFLGIALFATILFAISAWQSRDRPAVSNHPGKLFSEFAKLLSLNRVDQHVLKSIATQNEFASPAQLFLSPGIFDSAVRHWHHSGMALGDVEKAAVVRIRARIFGPVGPPAGNPAVESHPEE